MSVTLTTLSLAWQFDKGGRERGYGMSGVRVLVGTRKGAFVLTSDGSRKEWDVSTNAPLRVPTRTRTPLIP